MDSEQAKRILELRFGAGTQARIDKLAQKANDGLLSQRERAEYEIYVEAIDQLSLLHAKARRFIEGGSD